MVKYMKTVFMTPAMSCSFWNFTEFKLVCNIATVIPLLAVAALIIYQQIDQQLVKVVRVTHSVLHLRTW